MFPNDLLCVWQFHGRFLPCCIYLFSLIFSRTLPSLSPCLSWPRHLHIIHFVGLPSQNSWLRLLSGRWEKSQAELFTGDVRRDVITLAPPHGDPCTSMCESAAFTTEESQKAQVSLDYPDMSASKLKHFAYAYLTGCPFLGILVQSPVSGCSILQVIDNKIMTSLSSGNSAFTPGKVLSVLVTGRKAAG